MGRKMEIHPEEKKYFVEKTIFLINQFRGKQIEYEKIDSILLSYANKFGLEEEKFVYEQMVSKIQKKNPKMLSRKLIHTELLFGLIGSYISHSFKSVNEEEIRAEIENLLSKFFSYDVKREIETPLINLSVGRENFKFGGIEFFPITDDNKKKNPELWEKIKNHFPDREIDSVQTIARIICIGDDFISLQNAELQIHTTLNVIRGIGFPIDGEDRTQIGVLGEFSNYSNQIFLSKKPTGNLLLNNYSGITRKIGPNIHTYDLQNELLIIEDFSIISKVSEMLQEKSGQDNKNNLRTKAINGLLWIGESTRPDLLSSRYMKLAIALETLISGESKDNNLLNTGITAALAERGAFLLEDDFGKRREIHNKITHFYGKRSKIVHEGSSDISVVDYMEFGTLVRKIAFSLIKKLDKLKSFEDLANWVMDQRYS